MVCFSFAFLSVLVKVQYLNKHFAFSATRDAVYFVISIFFLHINIPSFFPYFLSVLFLSFFLFFFLSSFFLSFFQPKQPIALGRKADDTI